MCFMLVLCLAELKCNTRHDFFQNIINGVHCMY